MSRRRIRVEICPTMWFIERLLVKHIVGDENDTELATRFFARPSGSLKWLI